MHISCFPAEEGVGLVTYVSAEVSHDSREVQKRGTTGSPEEHDSIGGPDLAPIWLSVFVELVGVGDINEAGRLLAEACGGHLFQVLKSKLPTRRPY